MDKNKEVLKVRNNISNLSIPNKEIREQIEGIEDLILGKPESDEILDLIKKHRPELYKQWMLEIATKYM